MHCVLPRQIYDTQIGTKAVGGTYAVPVCAHNVHQYCCTGSPARLRFTLIEYSQNVVDRRFT